MTPSTRRRLAHLTGFCVLVAVELDRLAADGSILLKGDALSTVARLLGADVGERRLLKRYLEQLIGLGFLRVESERLAVGFVSDATTAPAGMRTGSGRSEPRVETAAPSPAAGPRALSEPVPQAAVEEMATAPATVPETPAPPVAAAPAAPAARAQGMLFDDEPAAPAKKKRAQVSKSPDGPLPFLIAQALEALARTAGPDRFVAGEPRDVGKVAAIQITRQIRRYPTLEQWQSLGHWLASGLYWKAEKGPLGPQWVAGGDFNDAMAKARAWAAAGQPSGRATGRRGYALPSTDFGDDGEGMARVGGVR